MYFTKFTTPMVKSIFVAASVAALLVTASISAAERNSIELAASPYTELSILDVQTQATGWSVRGQLRLLDNPLRHSNPGQVRLVAIASNGQILTTTNTMIYRVVTANPRARVFGFVGTLTDGFPTGTTLRVQHLPAVGP